MAKNKLHIKKEHTLDDLTSVSQTVLPLAKQLLGLDGMVIIDLISNWDNIVGKTISQYSLPQKIFFKKGERINGCLEIISLSGAFAMEIQQNEKLIIDKVNTFFGYSAINKLKVIQNSCPNDFLINKKPIDNVKKNLVTDEEENYITELTSGIDNSTLKDRLEKLGRAIFSNTKK